MCSLRYLNGRTLSPFPAEAGQKFGFLEPVGSLNDHRLAWDSHHCNHNEKCTNLLQGNDIYLEVLPLPLHSSGEQFPLTPGIRIRI